MSNQSFCWGQVVIPASKSEENGTEQLKQGFGGQIHLWILREGIEDLCRQFFLARAKSLYTEKAGMESMLYGILSTKLSNLPRLKQ